MAIKNYDKTVESEQQYVDKIELTLFGLKPYIAISRILRESYIDVFKNSTQELDSLFSACASLEGTIRQVEKIISTGKELRVCDELHHLKSNAVKFSKDLYAVSLTISTQAEANPQLISILSQIGISVLNVLIVSLSSTLRKIEQRKTQ